jgi:hypothetical protein
MLGNAQAVLASYCDRLHHVPGCPFTAMSLYWLPCRRSKQQPAAGTTAKGAATREGASGTADNYVCEGVSQLLQEEQDAVADSTVHGAVCRLPGGSSAVFRTPC